MKWLRLFLLSLTVLVFCLPVNAGKQAPKEYPITVKVIENLKREIQLPLSGSNTDCRNDGFGNISCGTKTHGGGQRTIITTLIAAPDGLIYEVEWRPGAVGSFFQGGGQAMSEYAGGNSRVGGEIPLGEYKARREGNRFSLQFVDAKGRAKEWTFLIVGTRPPPEKKESSASRTTVPAVLTVNSNPTNAEIWVDGQFMGNTTSKLRVTVGTHKIALVLNGFEKWEREITLSSESEINVNADLVKKP